MSKPTPHKPEELLELPIVQKVLNNKILLFTCLGLVGGCVGSLAAELPFGLTNPLMGKYRLGAVVAAAIFAAVATSGIAIGLFLAEGLHRRSPKKILSIVLQALPVGMAAGAIGGGVAELIYGTLPASGFREYVIRPICWGLMGGLIGAWFSRVIPNLGLMRGLLSGLFGGVIGGAGFVALTSIIHVAELGRFLGLGLLGMALGLAVSLVEKMFREATLEVIWTPGQSSQLTLGENPISIGGGDDHIRIKGLKPHSASVVLQDGKIQYIDIKTGKRTDLKNGSKLKIAKVQLVIHAENTNG
jgi:hypothetical protein